VGVANALEVEIEGASKPSTAAIGKDFSDLGAAAGKFHWASPWMTAGVPLPLSGNATERWFRIRGADNQCGVMVPTAQPMLVIIDQVELAG
jgi:hypothetical protein